MTISVLRFDLRRAPFSPVTVADQYRESVAMARWADRHGFLNVTVSEHHGVDFISAPTALAGMILGATENLGVMIGAVIVPLHDPVRLAEQVATLDLASGGRFSFVAGVGYRPEEFAMAGIDNRYSAAGARSRPPNSTPVIRLHTREPISSVDGRIVPFLLASG